MPKKIEGRRVGRRDYTRLIEASVVPVVKWHQSRISWAGQDSISVPPGAEWDVFLLVPKELRGSTIVLFDWSITLEETKLVCCRIKNCDLEKYVNGLPYNLEIFHVGYNYGEYKIHIERGIPFRIAEDLEVFSWFPQFLKTSPTISFVNKTTDTVSGTLYYSVVGMTDRKPWWY